MKILFTLVLALSAYAADDVCKPIFDATDKTGITANHMYTTSTKESQKGRTVNGELIRMGGPSGAMYVLVEGKWKRVPGTPADMLKQSQENRNTTKHSCRYVREEAVNGEATVVYAAHSESEYAKVDMTVWISKSKGLTVRQDVDMDVGGLMGKSHTSSRYDYTNVAPPPGVQ
jgi:hypothetical protein